MLKYSFIIVMKSAKKNYWLKKFQSQLSLDLEMLFTVQMKESHLQPWTPFGLLLPVVWPKEWTSLQGNKILFWSFDLNLFSFLISWSVFLNFVGLMICICKNFWSHDPTWSVTTFFMISWSQYWKHAFWYHSPRK